MRRQATFVLPENNNKMSKVLLSNLRKNLDKKKEKSVESIGEVNLFHFELLDIIGQGAFGKVSQLYFISRFA